MKIAVFFQTYRPMHEAKEGNLVLGLREAGADVELVTEEKTALAGHTPPYPVRSVPAQELVRSEFWAALDADVVLAYTFLNWRYTPVLRAIKTGGKPLVVRADSDGQIGRPRLPRRFYLDPAWSPEGIKNLARRAAWRVVPQRMAARRLDHIALPDAIFIESPGALANLSCFLAYWKRLDLLEKIRCIPMTIGDEFVAAPLEVKSPVIVSVGRWTDRRQKNTGAAVHILRTALAARPHCKAKLIGGGDDVIRRILKRLPQEGKDRLEVTGSIPHDALTKALAAAQILFMPSNWEGFALAAGEAVCMGCSIAASPIGALQFLAQGGRFGTLSPDYTEAGLLGALLAEIDRWGADTHDPQEIAEFWRSRINRRTIGSQLVELAGEALEKTRG